jgi:transcriptional regulator with XRE-family HTH domain
MRRRELHDFLKAARARVQPEDLGLTPPRNRRSSGLQQADLAAALDVSQRWYNGFENGAAGADDLTLDRIARILQLTPAERLSLYLLATGHAPAPATIEPPRGADTALARLVRQMAGPAVPAVVTDIAWNVLARNEAVPAWFPGPGCLPASGRNAVLWAFTREIEGLVDDIGSFREVHIGWVHLALAGHPGDPGLARLVDRLSSIPAARKMWDRYRIAAFTQSITPVRFRLPGPAGAVEGDLVSMDFPGEYRLMMVVPHGGWPSRQAGFPWLTGRRNRQPSSAQGAT